MATKHEAKTFVAKLQSVVFTEAKDSNKSHKVTLRLLDDVDDLKSGLKLEIYADKKVWSKEDFEDAEGKDIEGDAVFDKVPSDEGAKFFYSLTKWNGKEKEAYDGNKGGGKGRNGGGSYQPKSPEEIHSTAICGIIKSAMELAATLPIAEGKDGPELTEVPSRVTAIANAGILCYEASIARLSTGKAA